jgi:23S rRNA pseudouridine2605 synthase
METQKKRLSKALAAAGIASRRAAEELIFSGKVSVNGKTILVPQTLVSWDEDVIMVSGHKVSGEEKKVYYILNKPTGYICSNKRVGTKRIVLDIFEKVIDERLFTVGRLDRDTSGLLIVTNDGHFANRVIHPSARISKEYLIKTVQEVGPEHLEAISKGTFLEGGWVKPVRVIKVRKGTIKISVMEGKKREVRILVQNAGLDLVSLERIRIGGLLLGNIPVGTWREMTEKDKQQLLQTEGGVKAGKPPRSSFARSAPNHGKRSDERPARSSFARSSSSRGERSDERPARPPFARSSSSSRRERSDERPGARRSPYAKQKAPRRPQFSDKD